MQENTTKKADSNTASLKNSLTKNFASNSTNNWYSNRYQIVLIQRNILLILTALSIFSVSVAIFFVKNTISSKSLEPYLIQVEEKTGIPTVVKQMTAEEFTGNSLIRQYFINQFVQSAMGYDPATYKQDADKVRLFSTPAVYADFRKRINARELGPNSDIQVRIKSIQFPSNSTAQVRVARQTTISSSDQQVKNEIITIEFYFADVNLSLEDRLINPLGFQVSKFLIAEETFNY
jgi:type IV secretion system protein VirB8